MKNKEIQILLVVITTIYSCANKWNIKEKSNDENEKVEESIFVDSIKNSNPKYLKMYELWNFVKEASEIKIKSKFKKPFDTLQFNKVIAYDFDGGGERANSVIDKRFNNFSRVILRQKELSLSQAEFLLKFITDNKTYGEKTAACFDPHLGIVFYEGEKRQFVIDVCLDCNFLQSTVEIPATQYKRMEFENGTSYGLKGFSKSGKNKIIQLSKELGLDYGTIEQE